MLNLSYFMQFWDLILVAKAGNYCPALIALQRVSVSCLLELFQTLLRDVFSSMMSGSEFQELNPVINKEQTIYFKIRMLLNLEGKKTGGGVLMHSLH